MWDEIGRRADDLLRRSRDLLDLAVTSRPRQDDRAPVSLQRLSSNSKLAPQRSETARSGRIRFVPVGPFMASTYASIRGTCPSGCPWRDGACYGAAGLRHMHRLDDRIGHWSPLQITQAEARLIDRAWVRGVPRDGHRGGRDLRLHVVGEVSCRDGALELGNAARRFQQRGGGSVFTFTHRWEQIERSRFGPISALASVETGRDADRARERGYAAAIVVPGFDSPRQFRIPKSDQRAIPCPHEAGSSVTCASCRLCMDGDRLRDSRRVIAFALHGLARGAGLVKLRMIESDDGHHAGSPAA